MLRIYLDEAKWIDLSRAVHGVESGKPYQEAALVMGEAVQRGYASFPLSMAHYIETWRKRQAGPRRRLAHTMAAFSLNHAIAPHLRLLPGELDRALQRRFGRPISLSPLQPFGWGLQHCSGGLAPQLSQSTRARILAAFPTLSDRALTEVIDRELLAGPPEDLPVAGIALPPVQPARDFATAHNETVKLFIEHNADTDTRRRAVAARELIDLYGPLSAAMARAGIGWEQFLANGPEGVSNFMLDLPSRAPGFELMRLQHDNQQTAWKPNDMTDIGYLSVAVGYCDIVVTENKWTDLLNRKGFAKRFRTTVINDLAELRDLLIATSLA
jgi:hypothetical protein